MEKDRLIGNEEVVGPEPRHVLWVYLSGRMGRGRNSGQRMKC